MPKVLNFVTNVSRKSNVTVRSTLKLVFCNKSWNVFTCWRHFLDSDVTGTLIFVHKAIILKIY